MTCSVEWQSYLKKEAEIYTSGLLRETVTGFEI